MFGALKNNVKKNYEVPWDLYEELSFVIFWCKIWFIIKKKYIQTFMEKTLDVIIIVIHLINYGKPHKCFERYHRGLSTLLHDDLEYMY